MVRSEPAPLTLCWQRAAVRWSGDLLSGLDGHIISATHQHAHLAAILLFITTTIAQRRCAPRNTTHAVCADYCPDWCWVQGSSSKDDSQ